MVSTGRKTSSLETEMGEKKVAVAEENVGTVVGSGAHVVELSGAAGDHHHHDHGDHRPKDIVLVRKGDVAHAIVRALSVASAVTAVLFMVTAEENGTISVYGFSLPVYSKWSFSDSFEYLVGVSAAVAAHSLLQLLLSTSRMLRKSSVIPSRNHAWLIFASDQVFAYAMMSAGSAASGVGNLNRTGIRHTAFPNFCKPLHIFCDHVAISIAFTFFTCFLLAISAVQDVICLANN
ncbi:Casparian strip membrane protein [Trema orientale]|uniref:CASP-like protein n=1 Tax=Trema orientale TaxID=63057 RepID=A0A2P5ESQ1_TREOI|nr:Casparian strip membrane protein [Trema orientale]